MQEAVRVGLLGCGTVGSGVVKILQQNASIIARRAGAPVMLERVLVRDVNKPRAVDFPAGVLTDNPEEVLDDPKIDIIVEVIGGIEPAGAFIRRALKNGKNVVTANKDLLAAEWADLMDLAETRRLDLLFEASVGGGIPIIRPLSESLSANRIEQVLGIVNGTTNYVLTEMSEQGKDMAEVLQEAIARGYAEPDPTADITGLDAARKIAILGAIAFGAHVQLEDVSVTGITSVNARDILYAKELGYVIKLVGVATEEPEGVEVRVGPVLLPKKHPLAAIRGVHNAIFVRGDAVGEAMFYGLGAGSLPTASSVISDIVEAVRNLRSSASGRWIQTGLQRKPILTHTVRSLAYYLRLEVTDRPGVLAAVAGLLAEYGISLRTVIQRPVDGKAELVLVTHPCLAIHLDDAMQRLSGLAEVERVANCFALEGEEER
ncbi:MAG: homoserine dehydrogenase [Firmicutes bacterium]|nr:homoserine dehydrogenase [Bacillota bacterium]